MRYISLKNESEVTIKNNFLNKNDLDILERLKSFQNNPNSRIKIAIPTLLSMLVCPMTILIYQPLVNYTWPKALTAPDINSAINCFLMPAGFVYVIAFGFIFQDVMTSFQKLSLPITEEISMFNQIVNMANTVRSLSDSQKRQICLCIKDEIM